MSGPGASSASLADGSLEAIRGTGLRARLAGSPALRAAFERQRAGAAALRGLNLQAPASLRARLDTQKRPAASRGSKPDDASSSAAGWPAAAAAAVLAVVLVLPAGREAQPSSRARASRAAVHRRGCGRSSNPSCSPQTSGVPSATGRGSSAGARPGSARTGSAIAMPGPCSTSTPASASPTRSSPATGSPRPATRPPRRATASDLHFAQRPWSPGSHLVARRPGPACCQPRMSATASCSSSRPGRATGRCRSDRDSPFRREERRLDPEAAGDHIDRLFRVACAMCGSRDLAGGPRQETYAKVLSRPRLPAARRRPRIPGRGLAEHLVQPSPRRAHPPRLDAIRASSRPTNWRARTSAGDRRPRWRREQVLDRPRPTSRVPIARPWRCRRRRGPELRRGGAGPWASARARS